MQHCSAATKICSLKLGPLAYRCWLNLHFLTFSSNLCLKFAELRDLAKVGQSNPSGWAFVVLFYAQPTNLFVLGRIWTKKIDQNGIFYNFGSYLVAILCP